MWVIIECSAQNPKRAESRLVFYLICWRYFNFKKTSNVYT
jgi:hypothetical protein